jgi:electron transfer flavoprotein beta subunit
MKIIVLMKEVPDTYGDRVLDLETGLAERAASEAVLDEIGERALEAALAYADMHAGTEIVVLSVGPETVSAALRKALAMGAGSAVHVVDEGLAGADLGLTSELLAAAIRRTGFDLVLAGNLSTDGAGGVVPSMVAELLGVPAATNLSAMEISEATITGVRVLESGSMDVAADLPAVVSVTEALPEARFPNFKGIMAAKKKPFQTLTLADLGVDAGDETAGRSIVVALSERPARAAGVKIIDEGDAASQLADFLVQNRLV